MESAEEVSPVVLDWLDRNADEDNWMLYVNFWDPHTPYRAPQSLGNPFEHDPLPEWLSEDVLQEHQKKVGPHGVNEINMYNSDVSPITRVIPERFGRWRICGRWWTAMIAAFGIWTSISGQSLSC